MLYEAAPYFIYGTAYMAFILLPHMLGWLGHLGVNQVRSWAVTVVEVGLTASMPPIMVAGGVAEHTLRRFWRYAPYRLAATSGAEPTHFCEALVLFHGRFARIYLGTVLLLSLITQIVFQWIVDMGALDRWLPMANTGNLLFLFRMGLIAYALLGMGIFSCMFCITIGAPKRAMQAVRWGLLTTLFLGIPLSRINYTLSVLAFVIGAFVFVIAAWWSCHQVLRRADYYFALAL